MGAWTTVDASVCGHETKRHEDWDYDPPLCTECRQEYPPEEVSCELCAETFKVSSVQKYKIQNNGWDLPKKCKSCVKHCKLIWEKFNELRSENPGAGLYLEIKIGDDLLDHIGAAITLSSLKPVGIVTSHRKPFKYISVHGTGLPDMDSWHAVVF